MLRDPAQPRRPVKLCISNRLLGLGSGATVNQTATGSMALGAGAMVGTGAQNSVAFGPSSFVENSNTFAMGVANSIFEFSSLATPTGLLDSVPSTTTTTSNTTGTVWSVVNQTYSDGSLSSSSSNWYNSSEGAIPSASDLNASGTASNIYKVVTTSVLSSTQNMIATTYNRASSAPVITGADCNVNNTCVNKSTAGDLTTYTSYSNFSTGAISSITQVNTTPAGIAYGSVDSSGTSYVVSAYNSGTNFKTTTTTSHNATLTGDWVNATGTFSTLMVDHTGKLFFSPHSLSNTTKYIANGQAVTTTTVYNSTSGISTSTTCNSSGSSSTCSPPAPTNTTTVTSTSSSSGSASIGGWKDPVTSVSQGQSRVADLLSKFKGSSMAYGASSDASGSNNIAYGHGSQAHGDHSNNISFGTSAESDGTNGVAFGAGSRSNGANALAFGASSRAEGNQGSALERFII